jgi:hypothetical protein
MADITTMQDLLKLQQEANDLLAKKVEPMRSGKLPPVDDLLAERATDAARAKEALENAIKQRDAVVKTWDDRVNRLRARVDKLSTERKQADDLLQRAKKDRAKKDRAKKDDRTKKPPVRKRPPNE